MRIARLRTDGKRNHETSSAMYEKWQSEQAFDTRGSIASERIAARKKHLADLIVKAGNRDGASSPANS